MQQHELSAKQRFTKSLADFIQRHRVLLIIGFLAVLAALLAYGIFDYVSAQRELKYIGLTEQAQESYSKYLYAEGDEKDSLREEIKTKLDEVLNAGGKRYAKERAHFLSGTVAVEDKDWASAAEHYMAIFDGYPRSYLAPVAAFDAAGAYEESGDTDTAITVLKKLVDIYSETSSVAPRALFNLGRLQDTTGSTAEALLTYNRLVDLYPDSNWTKLARTRIIALNTE